MTISKSDLSMLNRLKRVRAEDFRRYLSFWNRSGIEIDDNSILGQRLKSIYPDDKVCSDGKGDILFVAQSDTDRRNDVLDVRQLVYDLEVFASIPCEIYDVIVHERFCEYIRKTLEKMSGRNWKILLSSTDNVYLTSRSLFKKEILSIDDVAPETICGRYVLINCGEEKKVNAFYEANKAKARIERHRLLELFREWLIEEICGYFGKILGEKGVSLYLLNWNWAQDNYLFPKKNITSLDKEERSAYSVLNISGREKEYEPFLSTIYGKDYSQEYVKCVFDIPLRADYGTGCIRHIDKHSQWLNVVFSNRATTDTPETYCSTVYMLGGCVFFGYAIDDSHTVASCLQRRLNADYGRNMVNVVNMATWGGNIDQTYMTFYDIVYRPGDVVVVSYAGLLPAGNGDEAYDVSTALSRCDTSQDFYFDGVVHCNSAGYALVAERLQEIIKGSIGTGSAFGKEAFRLTCPDRVGLNIYESSIKDYIASISHLLPPLKLPGKTYGSIVMNCNPFTRGHRYLVEYAAARVDYLIIFVVEENRSFFPFEDRIDLVRKGTNDLKNVYVVPSGNLIISAVTFPGYFQKDNPDKADTDSSSDAEIFARYIAPSLGITVRFLGEEPTDKVTRQYNNSLRVFLPRFGINVTIVPRVHVENDDGTVISASIVRRLVKQKEFERLKKFVPETTLAYLIQKFGDSETQSQFMR